MQFDVCEPKPDGSCEVLQNGATVVQGTYLLWRTYMIVYGQKKSPFSLETSWTFRDRPVPTVTNTTWSGFTRPDDCRSLGLDPCQYRFYADVEKTYDLFNKTHPVGHWDPFPVIGISTLDLQHDENPDPFQHWTADTTGRTTKGLVRTISGPKNVTNDDPRLDYHTGTTTVLNSTQSYRLDWGMYWLPTSNSMSPRGASGYLYVVPNINKTEVPNPPYVPRFTPPVYRASNSATLGSGSVWIGSITAAAVTLLVAAGSL